METIDLKRLFEEAKASLTAFDVQIANKEEEVKKLQAERDAVANIYNAIAPLRGVKRIPTIADATVPPTIDLIQTAGISVAIRSVLDLYKEENFTASQMRDRLEKHGWEWGEYKNPLSTVHTTLIRLVQSESAKDTIMDGKKVFYSVTRPKKELFLGDLMRGYKLGGAEVSIVSTMDQIESVIRSAPTVANTLSGALTIKTSPDKTTLGSLLKGIDIKK